MRLHRRLLAIVLVFLCVCWGMVIDATSPQGLPNVQQNAAEQLYERCTNIEERLDDIEASR